MHWPFWLLTPRDECHFRERSVMIASSNVKLLEARLDNMAWST